MIKQEQFLASAAKAANIILTAGGVLSLLVLLRLLYQYGWTGEKEFATSTGVVVYCIIPAVVGVLLFASLRLLRPTYKIILSVLCIVIVTSAYGAELFMPVPEHTSWVKAPIGRKDEVAQLAKRYDVDFDMREPAQMVAELRKQGVEAVPAVFPRYLLKKHDDESMKSAIYVNDLEVIPVAGIGDRLTVLCNQSGQYVTYKSDEHGFHNPKGIWQSGSLDIAALGKSFTQGFCVPSDKNFVALIRQRHPATLNLGMATHGPLFMLAALKEYLPLFTPKVVLWFYVEGNHVLYLQHEKKSPLLTRYLTDDFSQGLRGRQADIGKALMDYVEKEQIKQQSERSNSSNNSGNRLKPLFQMIKLPALRQKMGLIYGTHSQSLEELADLESNMNLFRDILSQAKLRVSGWGGTLYFVYLPDRARFANNEPRVADNERTRILTLAASLGIPSIDLHAAFQAQGDPLSLFPFRRFHHYNEQGHRIVADEVLKAISVVVESRKL
jgi:hypothetical protein